MTNPAGAGPSTLRLTQLARLRLLKGRIRRRIAPDESGSCSPGSRAATSADFPSIAKQCAAYLHFARTVLARRGDAPGFRKELEAARERAHALAREGLAMFAMFAFEHEPFATVRAEGLDAEIADPCAPLD